MDLAKNFAQWRDASPEQWIALANRYLPPIVVALLVLLLAFQAADLTWRLLETPAEQDFVPAAVRAPGPARAGAASSYETLAAWEPFGKAPDESGEPIPAEAILDAPETSLNLQLAQTWQAQELPERGSVVIPEHGIAVIASGRAGQKMYKSGDTIEGVGNTTLHSVFRDRVVLDRGGGRLESLRWPESDGTPAQASRLSSRPAVRPVPQQQSPSAAVAMTEAVSETVAALSEHMQIAMHNENGEMVGFRLQPRGDGQIFAQLGLEAGDVLIDVNGLRLNDVRNATRVLQALGETPQATVTIRRNGADQALVLDVGQIQRLAESLQ